jgi:hypothetical protein
LRPCSRTSFHHQPEAQHPNSSSTSWQADYPIFPGQLVHRADIPDWPSLTQQRKSQLASLITVSTVVLASGSVAQTHQISDLMMSI